MKVVFISLIFFANNSETSLQLSHSSEMGALDKKKMTSRDGFVSTRKGTPISQSLHIFQLHVKHLVYHLRVALLKT